MLRRVTLELGTIALVAAVAGTVASHRWIAPWLGSAFGLGAVRRGPVVATAAPPADPGVLASDRPAEPFRANPAGGSPAQNPDPPDGGVAVVRGARGVFTQPRRAVLPPGLVRTGNRWTLDLRGDGGEASDRLAGTDLALVDPSEGGGYRIQSRDRAGYLAAAGVSPGDVLEGVNGRPTLNADQAIDALAEVRTAPRVTLRFRRGRAHYTVSVDLLR